MSLDTLFLDRDAPLSLQQQIRRAIVDGILAGSLPASTRLPSSRRLAERLGVSRVTVDTAYQSLVDDGFVVSRPRSGLFVAPAIPGSRNQPATAPSLGSDGSQVGDPLAFAEPTALADPPSPASAWTEFPFPFVDGHFDASLFPLAEWREASRLALGAGNVEQWATATGEADDPQLIEQIRTKFLTRRGIHARSEEILVTLGTQNSLYLICALLAGPERTVAMEDPGNPVLRELLREQGAALRPCAVDDNGLQPGPQLANCDWVYVTPSHQIPTAVAMTLERRQALLAQAERDDFLVIEDDYQGEINYLERPRPALRSMDQTGRVIYVAELSRVLSPGIQLGFIVADPAFIRRARSLRRRLYDHPPLNNQRTAAHLLAQGHYDAIVLRLGKVLHERRLELRDALSNMRGVPLRISPATGGTAFWVKAPRQFNVTYFVEAAARQGILLESVERYYQDPATAENCLRMSVTSIPQHRIVPGVRRLVALIRKLVRDEVEQLDRAQGEWLRGEELISAMAGATVLYEEVYGTLCTIELHPDGTMTGRMNDDGADRDSGFWRVEGDRFLRRWLRWNYAVEDGYFIVLEGDRIKYFNDDGQIVDAARYLPP